MYWRAFPVGSKHISVPFYVCETTRRVSFLQRLPSGNRGCSTPYLTSVCTLKQSSGWGNGLVLFAWLAIASINYRNITSSVHLSLITNHVARDQYFSSLQWELTISHWFQIADHLSTTIILKWCKHFLYAAIYVVPPRWSLRKRLEMVLSEVSQHAN